MALIDDLNRGAAWPPSDHAERIARQHEHALLIRNRRDELLAAYPKLGHRRDDTELVPYPSARVLARTYASLLFGEEPRLTHEDPAVRGAVEALAVATRLPALAAEAALTQAGDGEVWLRPSWDLELDPRHAIVDAVPGRRAVPVFRFGRVVEVAFVSAWVPNRKRPDDVLRHLEYHGPGTIRHRLFAGTRDNLGTPVRLDAYRYTSGLWSALEADPKADTDGSGVEAVILTGVERPLPTHVPLPRDTDDPHGLSPLDGTVPLVLALHRLYTQEQHDAELARRRIVVSRQALEAMGPRGPRFDRDADLLVLDDAAFGPVGAEGSPVQPVTFPDDTAMRDRIRSRLADLLVAAGIAPPTVLPDENRGQAPSGTSRRLAQSLTVSTVALAARYWQAGLSDAIGQALRLEVARALPDRLDPSLVDELDRTPVTATLSDGMVDDPVELATMVESLERSGSASRRTRVATVHPTWPDEEVDAEVARIVAEEPAPPPAPSPGGLTDLDPSPDGRDVLDDLVDEALDGLG